MTPEEQAALDAAQEKQIRDLASQITQMSKLGFDPMTIRKAIIGAVSDTTSPPTVSLNISGDTDTLVSEVRTLNNYTPLTGQTVLLAKQGTEIFILGAISATNPYAVGGAGITDNGWRQATLTNGSHGGNSNGNVYYRRILDHGSWKMQWRGGWNYSTTTMIGTADALDTDFRPSSKRSVIAARDVNTYGGVAIGIDFNTNGTVSIVAPNWGTSFINIGNTGSVADHNHSYTDYYGASGEYTQSLSSSTNAGHSHSNPSHSHVASDPTWVGLNGIEYFL